MTKEPTSSSSTQSPEAPPAKDYITKTAEALKRKIAEDIAEEDFILKTAIAQSLPASLDQMYKAREAFSSTAQSAFNQILLFYTAGSALLLAFMTQEKISGFNGFCITFLIILCFVTPACLASRWRDKLNAGYDLYAAAIIHSCVLHQALEIDSGHDWIRLMNLCKKEKGTLVDEPGETGLWRSVFQRDHNGKNPPDLTEAKHFIAVFRSRPGSLWDFYNFVFVWLTSGIALFGIVVSILVYLADFASQD